MSFRIGIAFLMLGIPGLLSETEAVAQKRDPMPLQLEAKIELGSVRGRIDHMAVDLKRNRLFVAELGNNSVGVIDLAARRIVNRITGLKEPQGIGYAPTTDTLYIANAGDGSVRLFRGADCSAIATINLGEYADNVRIDSAANRIFVGYGSGALAVIDVSSGRTIGDVPLKAHPESFQLDTATGRIFVNLPDAHSIAVLDSASLRQVANWPTDGLAANFPMALDKGNQQVLVPFRRPAKLGAFSMRSGSLVATANICGDADDIFVDAKRQRAYVSCGKGFRRP